MALVAVACVLAAREPARAQQEVQAASVHGRVATPHDSTERPIAGVMVTVHRVGADSSGPIDSARTDARGQFDLKYRRIRDDQAVYFAAAVFRGIAYFTAPLKAPDVRGDDA